MLKYRSLIHAITSKTLTKQYTILKHNYLSLAPNLNHSLEFLGFYKLYKPLEFRFSTNNKNVKCWTCGKDVNTLFCDSCNRLQKVDKQKNFFELLGVDYYYDLKLSDLTKKYRNLQSVLHPDKFGNKTQEEKAISEEYSSVINKAYSTLHHPVNRGLYMLKLKGITIEEGTIQLNPQFLMEIMERNEEIEEERDSTKLSQYNKINREQIDSLISALSTAFQNEDFSAAKEILTKLKYFTNIDSKIKDIKQRLGIPD